MNLRVPLVIGIVAAATGAAASRAFVVPARAPAFVTETPASDRATADPARTAARRDRAPRIVVYVAGEVRRGGIYQLSPSARAIDAVRAAGGATANADLEAVNLAQPLGDGDEVAVPALGAATSRHARAHASAQRGHHHTKKRHRRRAPPADDSSAGGAADSADPPATVVDLNRADESELETLPGVGAELAARILAFREQTGPFGSPDDLLEVSGMTEHKLDAIASYVSAGG